MLSDKRLHQTLNNVIIPSYDINRFQPIIFSTSKAKRDDDQDDPLSDVCIRTSATPYYFPPHYFEMNSSKGINKFNLVDGGVAANNPTFLAIYETTKEISQIRKLPYSSSNIVDCDLNPRTEKISIIVLHLRFNLNLRYFCRSFFNMGCVSSAFKDLLFYKIY